MTTRRTTETRPLRRVVTGGTLYAARGVRHGGGGWETVARSFSSFRARDVADAMSWDVWRERTADGGGCRHELYECGHLRIEKSDHIGPTNATRRRCGSCALGRPADWPLAATAPARLADGTPSNEPADPVARASRFLLRVARSRVTRTPLDYANFANWEALARAANMAAPLREGATDPADPDQRASPEHTLEAFLKMEYGREDGYTVRDLFAGAWAAAEPARRLEFLTDRPPAWWVRFCDGAVAWGAA